MATKIGNPEEPWRNQEGYLDPTVHEALKNVEEHERFTKFLKDIFKVCQEHGFAIDGRATFVDKKTGRRWT